MKDRIENKNKEMSHVIEKETGNLFSKMKQIASPWMIPVHTIVCLFSLTKETREFVDGVPLYLPTQEWIEEKKWTLNKIRTHFLNIPLCLDLSYPTSFESIQFPSLSSMEQFSQ